MAEPLQTSRARVRPGERMRLIEATQYRLPPAALVSILHRVSGVLIVVMLPLLIWLFDRSVTSEISYEVFRAAFASGIGIVPAFVVKLMLVVLIWAILHHLLAGVRHLWMDATHDADLRTGRVTALAATIGAALLTLVAAARLFDLF